MDLCCGMQDLQPWHVGSRSPTRDQTYHLYTLGAWSPSHRDHQSLQSLSHVQLFVTPWTAARQASLSITISQSLLKLMSIESVMPSNHLILCRPLLLPGQSFPESRSFPMGWFFTSGGQSTGVSASVSILPMNIQG